MNHGAALRKSWGFITFCTSHSKQILMMKWIMHFWKLVSKCAAKESINKWNVAIILDNASYYSRLKYRTPSTTTTIKSLCLQQQYYNKAQLCNLYETPQAKKPNSLQLNWCNWKLLNIQSIRECSEFIINKIIQWHGHEVLSFPPYHWNLNAIKAC